MSNFDNQDSNKNATESGRCKPGIFRCFMLRRRAWWKRKCVNRLAEQLDLEAPQREGLEAIIADVESLKATAFSSRRNVGTGLATAIQGESFDQTIASDALQEPINNIQSKFDTTLQRFGDWFNTLNESQQQKLREVLQRRFAH